MRLRVMTYNIRHGLGNDALSGGRRDRSFGVNLERTASIIRAEQPDIVAVQEVDRHWERSGCVDQPERLAGMLGMEVCFGANLITPQAGVVPAEYGTAILSRHPIVDVQHSGLPGQDGWEPRGLLRAEIETPAGRMVVLNTHLQIGFGDREAEGRRQRAMQALAVARTATEVHAPLVLMGDFNAEPGDAELRPLLDGDAGLTDAWSAAGDGEGFTIPAHPECAATKRIDLVLVNRRWTIDRVRVVSTNETRMSSDHLPVVADLELNG
jgi:endonuclease/exonuclease/phosphatase family metal-dependent hydrolase